MKRKTKKTVTGDKLCLHKGKLVPIKSVKTKRLKKREPAILFVNGVACLNGKARPEDIEKLFA